MARFTEVKVVFAGLQLVWLAINAFLFVHFYMAFLVERWFYTRVLLGVSHHVPIFEPCCVSFDFLTDLNPTEVKVKGKMDVNQAERSCFHFL